MNRHLSKDLDGGTARRSSKRSAHRPARRAAMTSLALSGALAVTAAVLTPSATAEVTADREGAAGRTAAIVAHYELEYNLAAEPRDCVSPAIDREDPGYCLDLYTKDTVRKKPLVVLIHGGGWISDAARRSSRFVRVAKDLAKAGYVALIMDYPKALERVGASDAVPGTTMQEDAVEQAVAWAKANRLTYNIDPSRVSFIGGSSGGQMSLLAAFNANQATPGKITMAYSLSGPVDLWKDINALQTGAADPAVDEGPPGYRNIELYLGCDWDGGPAPKPAPECREDQAKAVSPLFYGKNWISGDPGIRDSSCPLVRITRARTAKPPEDLAEAKALDDELWLKGCRTDPSVPANVDPQVLVHDLPGPEHGFDQWDVVADPVTGDTIGDQIIADLDVYMK